MPTHKAAEKHLRTSKKRRARNMAQKSMAKTAVKKVLQAEDLESGREALKSATSALDKLARKRIVPKKRVARHKSKLTKRVTALGV
ncbi:MAG: 30S ribosomal protein S20 [Gemmatimonadota bacterium]|nr:MAG: 30S ribosomal protein S20 [Gemmatimonadota bacterium]